MPRGDGTGPDGNGPKKVNKGFPTPKRDGNGFKNGNRNGNSGNRTGRGLGRGNKIRQGR